jgi:hypothetical protein
VRGRFGTRGCRENRARSESGKSMPGVQTDDCTVVGLAQEAPGNTERGQCPTYRVRSESGKSMPGV